MQVSQVVRDIHASIREIVNALANRLHAEDNFAPDGDEGQILTSRGASRPPNWQSPGGMSGIKGEKGDIGATGPTGPAGPPGAGASLPAGTVDRFLWYDGADWTAKRIVTASGDVVVAGGEVVVSS